MYLKLTPSQFNKFGSRNAEFLRGQAWLGLAARVLRIQSKQEGTFAAAPACVCQPEPASSDKHGAASEHRTQDCSPTRGPMPSLAERRAMEYLRGVFDAGAVAANAGNQGADSGIEPKAWNCRAAQHRAVVSPGIGLPTRQSYSLRCALLRTNYSTVWMFVHTCVCAPRLTSRRGSASSCVAW